MVAIDFLQFRKNRVRQPMQYAWCAATTRNFLGNSADKISKKEIDDLDISSLCDDIISEMSESQEGARLTLYLSSMLANGAVRLFQQQTTSLMDDCQKLMIDLLGGQDEDCQKKKKKVKGKKTFDLPPEEPINISIHSISTIDIEKVLNVNDAKDVHLITEMDFIEIPEVPQTFGFDPNHGDMTEYEMEKMYREMMDLDPPSTVPEHAPQDNGLQMNDEPMIPDPVTNLLESQAIPQGSPRLELEGMKTPQPKKPTRSKKSGPRSSSPSEDAKTAFSPQKKRPRMSYAPDQDANLGDEMMIPTEPGQEAAFPHDVPRESEAEASPVFDFKKKKRLNVTVPLRKRVADKGRAVAEMLDEPQLDDRAQLGGQMHHESAPADVPAVEAQVELPNMSLFDVNAQVDMPNMSIFNEPPPEVPQPKANSLTQSSDEPFRGFSQISPPPVEQQDKIDPTPRSGRAHPQPSPEISNRSLSALESFEEDPRKKYIKRGKKIFADRIKQVDIEPRPVNFMTQTRTEVLHFSALKQQSVLSLLSQPSTLRNRRFLPENRFWNDTLLAIHRENARVPPKEESAPKEKKKRARDGSQQRDEQNKGDENENMEIVPSEQREPSLPKNDKQQVVESTKQRNSLIIEDNHMDIETVQPTVQVPPADVPAADVLPPSDVQFGNQQEQFGNDVVQGAVPEFEQPPTVEPVFEKARTPEVNDKVEAEMSPSKRFKSRDDRELADGEPRSNRGFTVQELFEIIQSCWNKVKKRDNDRSKCVRVGFHKVIKPDRYSGVEAARYLQYCFILENEKKLYLQQDVPYGTAYLIKWQPALYEKKREKKYRNTYGVVNYDQKG